MSSDPILDVITKAIPVDPDDGCTVVGKRRNAGLAWGHPSTVAALIRDALAQAGLLLPPDAEVSEQWRTVYSSDGHTSDYPAENREVAVAAAKRASPFVDAHVERRTVRSWPDGSCWTSPWVPVDPAPTGSQSAAITEEDR